MATPKRTRATSSTTRSKKTTPQAQEITALPQTYVNLEEMIRFRAYELFEQRGGNHGYDVEDWLRAEHELTGRMAQSA